MKKFIYISGIASVNLMLFGALLKVLHLYGGGVLLTISILVFCVVFLPLALISSFKSQDERTLKWLYVITFIVFFIDLMGALFKLQHWPGASWLMLVGLPLPFVLFLPVYLYQTRKNKDKSVLNNLSVMFGLTFLAVFSVLLTLNVSSTFLENIALNSLNNENSAKFYQPIAKNYNNSDIIKQKSDELTAYIDKLKLEILTSTDNNQFVGNKLSESYNPLNVKNIANSNLPIFSAQTGDSKSKIEVLKNMIDDYKETISKSDKISENLKQLSNSLFDVSTKEIQSKDRSQKLSWEEREFPTTHLIIVLDALSRIQSNARFVEVEYLSTL